VAQVRPLYWPAPYQDSVASGRLILRAGTTANIRVAQPEDREALRAFFAQLSPESKQKRFFSLATPQLVDKVRGYGMRIMGPNCLGLLNTAPEVQLNASFSPIFPPPGRITIARPSRRCWLPTR